jgi:hypothetical protein
MPTSATQVYTRLDFQHLAKAYDAAHPRARAKSLNPHVLHPVLFPGQRQHRGPRGRKNWHWLMRH